MVMTFSVKMHYISKVIWTTETLTQAAAPAAPAAVAPSCSGSEISGLEQETRDLAERPQSQGSQHKENMAKFETYGPC